MRRGAPAAWGRLVRDAVHGARIAISGAGSSTVTAASGTATVELAPGRYTATATAVGYADAKTAFLVAP